MDDFEQHAETEAENPWSSYTEAVGLAASIADTPARVEQVRMIADAYAVPTGMVMTEVNRLRRAAMAITPNRTMSSALRDIDRRYRFFKAPNGVKIVTWGDDGGSIRCMKVADFRIEQPVLSDEWLQHPARSTISGFTVRTDLPPFATDESGCLNIWRGWGVAPAEGDPTPFRQYLEDVFGPAAGYVTRWCALCVQNPDAPTGVALMARGAPGTGKTKLGEIMSRLFGKHAAFVDDSDLLAGRFNMHLMDALFVHGDEVMWAGDRRKADKMKSRITSKTIIVEAKGQDAFTMPNRAKFYLTTNHDVAAHVERGDRRYVIVDTTDRRRVDREFFGALDRWLDAGGAGIVLWWLQSMDLTGFDPIHDRPECEGRRDAIIDSLTGTAEWLHVCAQVGRWLGHSFGQPETREEFYQAYRTWAEGQRHVYKPLNAVHFWRQYYSVLDGTDARAPTGRRYARRPDSTERRAGAPFDAPPFDVIASALDKWIGV